MRASALHGTSPGTGTWSEDVNGDVERGVWKGDVERGVWSGLGPGGEGCRPLAGYVWFSS